MSAPIRATIVVPAYNAEAVLDKCLAALVAQTGRDYEIIVVDDGSTDHTREVAARFPQAKVIRTAPRGAAAARNCGAREAAGELVLFTDADCEPVLEWAETLCAVFADPRVVGAKGAYRTRQRGLMARFVQLEYEEKYARLRRAATIDFVDTYSAAFRRDIFLANRGFDESFPGASVEDQEFSFRLAEQGYPMVFVPDAVVYHTHVTTVGAYARRKFRIGYWKVLVHRRHPGKMLSDDHTPPTLKIQMGLFLCIVAAALVALLVPAGWPAVAGLIAAFALSAIPLTRFVARRDKAVALVIPFFILVRAAALGTGWVAGSVLWFRK